MLECTVGFNARQCPFRTNVNWTFCPAQPKLIGHLEKLIGLCPMSDASRLHCRIITKYLAVLFCDLWETIMSELSGLVHSVAFSVQDKISICFSLQIFFNCALFGTSYSHTTKAPVHKQQRYTKFVREKTLDSVLFAM